MNIVTSTANAKNIDNNVFAALIFLVINMNKKNINAVNDIIASMIANVFSPSNHRRNAKGDIVIAASKLSDSNTFSDVVLFIITFCF